MRAILMTVNTMRDDASIISSSCTPQVTIMIKTITKIIIITIIMTIRINTGPWSI